MITRIELKNFMSHAHSVIEPAAGLTVLVGPNNVGKSAIVAALQILSHNQKSDYVIRHGEKECTITVETDDGHVIEWRRKRSPSYVIDGQQFDRLGKGGVPEELHPALRLPNFGDSNDSDFDIHFGMQKSPIFLLDSSPANAAKFFASSSDAIRLVSMQKRHKEKLSDAKKEKSRLETESAELLALLEHLTPVVEIDQRLEQVEADYQELLQLESKLEAAAELEQEIEQQVKVLSTWESRLAALQSLSEPPLLQPTESLVQLIADIQHAKEAQTLAEATAQALEPLTDPPVLQDVESLEQTAQVMLDLEETIRFGSQRCDFLNQLVEPPELVDTLVSQRLIANLESTHEEIAFAEQCHQVLENVEAPPEIRSDERLPELIDSLANATAEHRHWRSANEFLSKLSEPPRPVETSAGALLLSMWEQAAEQVETRQAEDEAAAKVLAEAAEALRSQAEGELCPLCGEPLDPDRLLASTAAGHGGHGHE